MTNRMKAILGASATIAVWATAFPFGKVALQSVDALTLSGSEGCRWCYTHANYWCV